MWNVIAFQNWKDAKIRVALIAHWDSRPESDQDRDPERAKLPIPGANDGASGVAILLELARVLKQTHPEVGVEYFLTDGEDLGPGEDEMYLGAIEYANHQPEPKATYGILLDMLGKKKLRVPMEPNSIQIAGNLEYALYRHAASVGLSDTFPMVEGPQIDDDHLPISRAGLPTIDLIDFDYMPYWHTINDTPDKCSAESLGKVGKLLQTWLEKKPAFDPKS
jgi:Zn-dependent M28 family amino/carboxypeptidase